MPKHDDVDAGIEVHIADGGWAVRPHGWTAVDGLPVADWRAYVRHRCEKAGVPYAFQIDLQHGVTAVINPRNAPDETAIADRIAELTRTPEPGDHDRR
jgi:hypothetical protein